MLAHQGTLIIALLLVSSKQADIRQAYEEFHMFLCNEAVPESQSGCNLTMEMSSCACCYACNGDCRVQPEILSDLERETYLTVRSPQQDWRFGRGAQQALHGEA